MFSRTVPLSLIPKECEVFLSYHVKLQMYKSMFTECQATNEYNYLHTV